MKVQMDEHKLRGGAKDTGDANSDYPANPVAFCLKSSVTAAQTDRKVDSELDPPLSTKILRGNNEWSKEITSVNDVGQKSVCKLQTLNWTATLSVGILAD